MTNVTTKIIIPTYNEADNLDDLISQILALAPNIGVIVVDDNSPDGTGALADAWVEKRPDHVHVIHREGKLGLGTAYIAGFRAALTMPDVDHIMSMDADFSHNPKYIPAMIKLSNHKHLVIGSRYVPGGGTANWPWDRIVLSKVGNFVAKTILGLEAMDCTAGFRLYRREVLQSIPLDKIFSSGYSFLVEMLFLCQQAGWQIGEVPILFEDRRAGTTKISQKEVWKAQYTLLRLFMRRISGRTPRQSTKAINS